MKDKCKEKQLKSYILTLPASKLSLLLTGYSFYMAKDQNNIDFHKIAKISRFRQDYNVNCPDQAWLRSSLFLSEHFVQV